MNRYLVQCKRDMQENTENSPDDYDENVRKKFDAFVNGLELDKKVIRFHIVEILSMISLQSID